MSQAAPDPRPQRPRPEPGRDTIRAVRGELISHLEQIADEHRRSSTAAALNFARYPDDPAARAEAVRAVAAADDVERFSRLAFDALNTATRRAFEKSPTGPSPADDIVDASVRED